MGASQARLPVHIDGETWDVTVRFRGAQPEPDLITCKQVDCPKCAHRFTVEVERAGSSPAPSPGPGVTFLTCGHCGKETFYDAREVMEIAKLAVTGNEGKDGFRHTGGSDGVADGRRDRADGHSVNRRVGTGEVPSTSSSSDVAVSARTMIWGDPGMEELHKRLSTLSDRNAKKVLWGELVEARKKIMELQSPAPIASPAVVTPEQFFENEISSGNVDRSTVAEYIRKQMFDFAERYAARRVSGLEAQLQQVREKAFAAAVAAGNERDRANKAEAELERMRPDPRCGECLTRRDPHEFCIRPEGHDYDHSGRLIRDGDYGWRAGGKS